MPALESRRVRTQPLTVTGASFGASPAKIPRTFNSLLTMVESYSGRAALSSDPNESTSRAHRSFEQSLARAGELRPQSCDGEVDERSDFGKGQAPFRNDQVN